MSDQNTTVFGIDLGTTYSCIAYVDQYGQPVVVPNAEGDLTTPSVVFFEDATSRAVGKEAKNIAKLYPDRVVEMVKRHMGKLEGEEGEEQKPWRFTYEGTSFSPEEISSYILRKLVNDAATQLGRPVTDVVITCPAYFGIAERDATAKAGQLAGLNVREIINEPTAAAIVYGVQNEKQNQVVLVYDLGGGTFDITMIEIGADGSITVVATGGDSKLGGRDWDEVIVNYLADEWMRETGSSDDPRSVGETLQDLWQKAEAAKRSLSAMQQARVPVVHNGQPVGVMLTREKFNELTAPLLERTIAYTRDTLQKAEKKGIARFDQLLLVGGSTKMPQVRERLSKEFGIEPKVHDPDQVVAKGAAIYGQKLMLGEKLKIEIALRTGTTPEEVDVAKVDTQVMTQSVEAVATVAGVQPAIVTKLYNTRIESVASHSFGVQVEDSSTGRDMISNLVIAQQKVPASLTKTYYTVVPNQEAVELIIIENDFGGDEDERRYELEKVKVIGTYLMELPSFMPKGSEIEVTCTLGIDGRLHVVAREPISRKTIEADIQTEYGLSKEEEQAAQVRSTKLQVR